MKVNQLCFQEMIYLSMFFVIIRLYTVRRISIKQRMEMGGPSERQISRKGRRRYVANFFLFKALQAEARSLLVLGLVLNGEEHIDLIKANLQLSPCLFS